MTDVRPQCVGEKCTICGDQARRKVAEELQYDEEQRHPLTAYICENHFRKLMGIRA